MFRLDLDPAAEYLRQRVGDAQAKPRAAELARRRAVGLREGIETRYRVALLLRHTDARVNHRKTHPVLRHQRNANRDRSGVGKLDRVAHQVHQDLAEASRIRRDPLWNGSFVLDTDIDALAGRPQSHQRGNFLDNLSGVRLDPFDTHLSDFDLRHVVDDR